MVRILTIAELCDVKVERQPGGEGAEGDREAREDAVPENHQER